MNYKTSDSIDSDLFIRYLEICNKALEANRERFPFKQILEAANAQQGKNPVDVCIIDDNPDPIFTLNLLQDKIMVKKNPACEECSCGKKWRVKKSYLKEVVENPQAYIENPAMINWEWIYQSNTQY